MRRYTNLRYTFTFNYGKKAGITGRRHQMKPGTRVLKLVS